MWGVERHSSKSHTPICSTSPSIMICCFFLFLFLPFFIYRQWDIWGTISWSLWCSEHWCRPLGNARKVKQWPWCVVYFRQSRRLKNFLLSSSHWNRKSFHFCQLRCFTTQLLSHILVFSFLFIFIYLFFALSEVRCSCPVSTIFSFILSGFGFL